MALGLWKGATYDDMMIRRCVSGKVWGTELYEIFLKLFVSPQLGVDGFGLAR